MTTYQKAKGILQGQGQGFKSKIQDKTHITTRETPLHYIKRGLRQQHSMVATQHDNNMVATQHGSSTKHGTNIIGHRQ
jgi:hypothetical protein